MGAACCTSNDVEISEASNITKIISVLSSRIPKIINERQFNVDKLNEIQEEQKEAEKSKIEFYNKNIEFYNGELNDYQEIISTLTNNGSQLQLKFDRLKNIISEKTSVLLNKDKEKSIKTMNEFRSFISENANNDLIQDNKGQGLGDKNLIGMAPGGLGEI